MNLSFFIHGVPCGNDVWGEGEGRIYVQNFYNGQTSPEQSKLFVEVLKNKNISYYTYLREKNIVSAEGRAGSYFGITIGFQNEFCTDFENLYKLFDLIYEKMVKNVLLFSSTDNEKFLISSFSEKEDVVKKIKDTCISQILKSFVNDVIPLDTSFSGESNGIIKSNVLDCGCKSFLLRFKKTLKTKISTDYPTKDALLDAYEINEKKILSLCKQQKEQIDTLAGQLNEKSSRLEVIESDYKTKLDELKDCKLKLSDRESECQNLQSRVDALSMQCKDFPLLKEQKHQLEKKLQNCSSELKKCESTCSNLQNLLDSEKQKCGDLKQKLTNFKEGQLELQKDNINLKTQIKSLTSQINQLQPLANDGVSIVDIPVVQNDTNKNYILKILMGKEFLGFTVKELLIVIVLFFFLLFVLIRIY